MKKKMVSDMAKKASKIKVNKNLKFSSMKDAPFFKKKMAEAERILATVELPK